MSKNILTCVFVAAVLIEGCSPKKNTTSKDGLNTDNKSSLIQINLADDSSYVTRNNYKAKFEPVDGIMHGAGQDKKGFDDYVSAVGRKQHPQIYMTYVSITRSIEGVKKWEKKIKKETKHLPEDVMIQVGLNMSQGNDTGNGQDQGVADGKFDQHIEALAGAIKNLNRNVFVRIGYEFEGVWNGYHPEPYKASFIKITKSLRAENKRVATVWCSGGGSAGFIPMDRLLEYYPGDEYVDWWGIDVFSPEEITHPALMSFFLESDKHQKPVMLGETTPRYVGTSDGQASWDKWYAPYFKMMYQNPQVKAHCYINWDWVHWSEKIGFPWCDWKDGRIEKNDIVKSLYQKEISKSFHLHAG